MTSCDSLALLDEKQKPDSETQPQEPPTSDLESQYGRNELQNLHNVPGNNGVVAVGSETALEAGEQRLIRKQNVSGNKFRRQGTVLEAGEQRVY